MDGERRPAAGSIDSIDGLEGYRRMMSPSPRHQRKNVSLDENGFISKVCKKKWGKRSLGLISDGCRRRQ